jgi:ubiquinone biosynthesis protein UbiJ
MTPCPFQPGREEESAWLADQAKNLEQQLAQVQKRLSELEKEKEKKK